MSNTSNLASFAALDQRVLTVEGALANLDRKVDAGLNAIYLKLDERNKTPWGVIFTALGIVLMFCTAIGGLAYVPIKADQVRVEQQIKEERKEAFDRERSALERDRRAFDLFMAAQRQLDQLAGSLRVVIPNAAGRVP